MDVFMMPNKSKLLTEFFALITEKMPLYSPSQRKIAEYILTEPNLLAHLSVIDMAKVTQTSQATVIRFCQLLGYDGFLEFSRHVRQLFQAYLSGQERLSGIEDGVERDLHIYGKSFSEVFYSNIEQQKARMDATIQSDDFIKIIDAMMRAEDIYLLGFMGSYSLTYMFYNMLYRVCPKVHMLEMNNTSAYSDFKNITKKSLVFNVIFPRYPIKSIEFTKMAKEKGAKIATITNSSQAPSLDMSDYALIAPVNTLLFVDSFTEPLGVFTALALKYAQVNKSDAIENLRNYDTYIEANDIFLKYASRKGE